VELFQSRFLTDDVQRLAAFYATLVGTQVALNDYYVEVQAGPASVGFSQHRYSELRRCPAPRPGHRRRVILDFRVEDADAEYPRIRDMGVAWVMPPTTQPWGNRSMTFADPEGNLINVFSGGADATK
jgi:predicted enzyme related to lactoylglutathione lyase